MAGGDSWNFTFYTGSVSNTNELLFYNGGFMLVTKPIVSKTMLISCGGGRGTCYLSFFVTNSLENLETQIPVSGSEFITEGHTSDELLKTVLSIEIPDELLKSNSLYIVERRDGKNVSVSDAIVNELAPSKVTIQINCTTENTTIRYTTDETNPSKDSNLYEGQFEVESGATIKAIGYKEGYIDSDVVEFTVS